MSVTTITNAYYSETAFYPNSNVDWGELGSSPYGTWQSWTTWAQIPSSFTLVLFEDAGFKDSRLPVLSMIWEGELTVQLKISDDVDSNLNLIGATTYNLSPGNTYSPIAGRYYEYTLTLAPDSNTVIPYMTSPLLDFETGRSQQFLESVDTATLAGTIDARQIDTTIGTVTAIVAVAQQEGVTYSSGLFQDRQYSVPDDFVFQENAIVVNIVDKSVPTIRCFDLNGESIDAVVDIWIQGLPSLQLTDQGVVRT